VICRTERELHPEQKQAQVLAGRRTGAAREARRVLA
jgi:hypothetical protein